jgi:hypothetical protein
MKVENYGAPAFEHPIFLRVPVSPCPFFILLICTLVALAELPLAANAAGVRLSTTTAGSGQRLTRDREVASHFAPVFYQALGDKPRNDYITNFDFDGDWRGDNNWDHADDQRFALKAYVYYSVSETSTHFFIHYAIFHPRDYKGGERKGAILSKLIREGAKRGGKYDPTGLAEETALAHENDLEGCLIVIAKDGNDLESAHVAYVETLHHNTFSKYVPLESSARGFEAIRLEGARALLYVEPKGHGIEAYTASEKQVANKVQLVYKYAARAEDPEKENNSAIGYDLLPIQTTLWAHSRGRVNTTYGETYDYGRITISLVQPRGRVAERKVNVGEVGRSFLGNVGGHNMARPPWAWFDRNDRNQPPGLWFFDPASIIKRDFHLDESFSCAYVRPPFWAVRKG